MAKISVVMPVYNVEDYLVDSIESILQQSYKDFELILVDDGSSDNSGKICDEYLERDERVKVYHQSNKGQAAARNKGVTEAQGQWVMFVDSDDIVHPRILEILLELVEKTGARIGMCDAQECENVPNKFSRCTDVSWKQYFVNENVVKTIYESGRYRYWTIWAKLIERELLIKNPFFEGKIFEDNAIVPLWIIEARTIVDTNLHLYFYRVNVSGTTKSSFNLKKLDYLWALNEQLVLYKKLKYDQMRNIIVNRYIDCLLSFYIKTKNVLQDKKATYELKKHFVFIVYRNWKYIEFDRERMKRIIRTFCPSIDKVYLCVKFKGEVK